MVAIDGRMGEGGGQVLRASLALSLATGTPFVIEHIRGGRQKPGLLRQHFTAVSAAAEIGKAETSEYGVGSSRLEFRPHGITSGDFSFAVGTAGSATLVLQTVLPPLVLADGPSHLVIEGGTHNPMAPPADFVEHTLIPALAKLGVSASVAVERMGFFPAGGGKIAVSIAPVKTWHALDLDRREKNAAIRAKAYTSQIPSSVGARELRVLREKLDIDADGLEVVEVADSVGPGNAVCAFIQTESLTEVVTGFGERGVRAERVAKHVVDEARRFLAARVHVGEHLADQLIVPMALGRGGRFLTVAPSRHLETVIEVTRAFLDIDITSQPGNDSAWEIRVNPAGG